MDHRIAVSHLDTLFHRLAVVNARLHKVTDEEGHLFNERREIMELISRERLGQSQQIVWKPGNRFTA